MSAERLMGKLRQVYHRCAHDVDSFVQAKGRLLKAYSETATAVQDLRVLQDASAVPVVASIPDFQAKLTARHLEKTEQLFARLQACLGELERVVRSVERAGAHAGQLLTSAGCGALAPGSCALAAGATPSLAQCVEGLQDIWRWMRDEWLLAVAAVGEVTYDSPPALLAGLAGVMAAAPCFSVPRVRDVLLRVLAAAPAPA